MGVIEERSSPTKGLNVFIDEGKTFEDCYVIGKELG
jgi:hypothetical protein